MERQFCCVNHILLVVISLVLLVAAFTDGAFSDWDGAENETSATDMIAAEASAAEAIQDEAVWMQDEKVIAITFDDGPNPETTGTLLDGLEVRDVRATFFVTGERAEENPQIIKRMAEQGHLIGNHTYSHVQLNALSVQQARAEVKAANDVIEKITGQEVIYLRPPYGEWNRKEDCPQDMIAVYWDIDPLDWKRTDSKQIAFDIINEVEPGDIILLHDIYKSSVEAALMVIDELQSQGYRFVTVEELLFV